MKILINLLSEQTLPNYIATLHERPDKVILLTTAEFKKQVNIFDKLANFKHEVYEFYPYDLFKNINILKYIFEKYPTDEIVINFTGGTKVMSLSAAIPGLEKRARLIYVDSDNNKIEQIHYGADKKVQFTEVPITVSLSFKATIALAGEHITSCISEVNEQSKERFKLLKFIAFNKQKFLSKQKDFFDKDENPKRAFTLQTGKSLVKWDEKQLELHGENGEVFKYLHSDGGEFFTGKWFEDYVFQKMVNSKFFEEVLMNVKIPLSEETIKKLQRQNRKLKFTEKNEFDVVLTKGIKSAIIECKSGRVTQDYIYKLAELRNLFLGRKGIAILVHYFQVDPHIIEKAANSKVHLIQVDQLNPNNILKLF